MICDELKNIGKYSDLIPNFVIQFLLNMDKSIAIGRYELDTNCYANVDEYFTKSHENCKLEAHKEYIDIQILLDGVERLGYISVEGLSILEAYDKNRDVMFFNKPQKTLDTVILENSKFVLLYPHEAHMPQMNANLDSQKVKKVVVKIKV